MNELLFSRIVMFVSSAVCRMQAVVVLCLFCLAVWGCTGTTPDPVEQSCQTNQDCPSQHTCVLGSCRSYQRATQGIISLRLLLSDNFQAQGSSLILARQHLLPLSLSSVHDKTLKALRTFRVRGVVRTREDKEVIPARIRFVSLAHIPGQPLEWTQTTDQRGFYEVRLTEGQYKVSITPLSKPWPTMHVQQVSVEKDLQQDWEVPRTREYVQVTGSIVTAQFAGSKRTPQAIEGLSVLLVSAKGKAVSNIAVTKQDGSFTLAYIAKDNPVSLRIQRKPGSYLHPMVEVPLGLIQKQEQKNVHPQTGQLLLSWGALPIGAAVPSIVTRGELRSNPEDGEQTVPGCHIRFTGKVVLGEWQKQILHGEYSVTVVSDSNGQYELQLPQGSYNVEVTPPPLSRWARGIFQSLSLQPNKLLVLPLQPKKELTGQLCSQKDSSGQCLKLTQNAVIRADWKGDLNGGNPKNAGIANQTQTQSVQTDGSYSLALDPGIYNLFFVPSADSGLSPMLYKQVRITGKNNRLDVQFSKANYIVSTLQDPSGKPLAGITVEMYEFVNSDQGNATLLGRAITNAMGQFSVPYTADMQRNMTTP